MTTFEHVRTKLVAERDRGVPFDRAWVKWAPPPDSALWATRPAWQRAYDGQPPEPGDTAAAVLMAALVEPEPGQASGTMGARRVA